MNFLWLENEIVEIEGQKYLNYIATERFLKFYPEYKLYGDVKLVSLSEARKTVLYDKASKILPSYKVDNEEDVYGMLVYDIPGILALEGKVYPSEILEYGDILTEANFGHKMDHAAFQTYFERNRLVTLSRNIEDLISKAQDLDEIFIYLTKHTRALAVKKYDKEKICDAVVDYIHGKGYDLATGDKAKELADFISKMVGVEDPLAIVADLTNGSELTVNEIFEGLNNGKSLLELIDPKAYEEYQAKEEAKRLAAELSEMTPAEITNLIIKKDKDLIIEQLDKFYDVLPEDKWNEIEAYLLDFVTSVFKRVTLDPENEKDLNKLGTILATICKFEEDTKSQLFSKIADSLGISLDSLKGITSAYAFGIGQKGLLGNLQRTISDLALDGNYEEVANILKLYEGSEDILLTDDFYHQLNMSPAMFQVKLVIARVGDKIPMPLNDLESLLIALQHCSSKNEIEKVIEKVDIKNLLILQPYLSNEPYYSNFLELLLTKKFPDASLGASAADDLEPDQDEAVEHEEEPTEKLDEDQAEELDEEPTEEPAEEPEKDPEADLDSLFDDEDEELVPVEEPEVEEALQPVEPEPEDVSQPVDPELDEELETDLDSLFDDEDEEEKLRVIRRRKPKTATDKKKVVYAVVAGVGIVSSAFMTFVLKQNPINVIKECATTFGRLLSSNASLGELAAKLGNLTAYFGSVLAALIGANKLGSVYKAEDLEPAVVEDDQHLEDEDMSVIHEGVPYADEVPRRGRSRN